MKTNKEYYWKLLHAPYALTDFSVPMEVMVRMCDIICEDLFFYDGHPRYPQPISTIEKLTKVCEEISREKNQNFTFMVTGSDDRYEKPHLFFLISKDGIKEV